MHSLTGLPVLMHYRQLLEEPNIADARRIMEEFYESFDRKGPAEILWFMTTIAMKTDNEHVSARERSDILFFYEFALAFFEAAWVIQKMTENKRDV